MSEQEVQWAGLMRAALSGDAAAYRAFLDGVTPRLRALAARGLVRAGRDRADAEDIVQETLLAIHLKRQTWACDRPIGPWLNAIARHKLVDALRRRGHHFDVPIDDVVEALAVEPPTRDIRAHEIERMLAGLKTRQRDVVRSITVDGQSISDTAARLSMTEGAVRVMLHRGLAKLAATFRDDEP